MNAPQAPAAPVTEPGVDVLQEARRRTARLRGLYIHACAFVLGNTTNILVNWLTLGQGSHQWWFQWALIAWSVALGVHAITVLGHTVRFGADWEERKVRQYLQNHPVRQARNIDAVRLATTSAEHQTPE